MGIPGQRAYLLTINCGSSTVKFALYFVDDLVDAVIEGQLEGIGTDAGRLTFKASDEPQPLNCRDHATAAGALIEWLSERHDAGMLAGIGHRIVHGMQHTQPQFITPELMEDLKSISVYDPEHLPMEIAWIEALQRQFPDTPQIACFDTGFHDTIPRIARQLSLPRTYFDKGIRRYGFHGLSYAYLLRELIRTAGQDAGHGRIIMAHLGNGASLAAIRGGQCIDTTMAFTPAAGIPMSTRTGDIDPGVAWYLLQMEQMSAKQFSELVNHKSGLLGISETTGNVRELLKICKDDPRAAEAIDVFCYQIKKQIGALAAALGGLDTLIFSGGIGEHLSEIRRRICRDLEFLGVDLDDDCNDAGDPVISRRAGKVAVRVMATNEQVMIARATAEILEEATSNVKA